MTKFKYFGPIGDEKLRRFQFVNEDDRGNRTIVTGSETGKTNDDPRLWLEFMGKEGGLVYARLSRQEVMALRNYLNEFLHTFSGTEKIGFRACWKEDLTGLRHCRKSRYHEDDCAYA